MNDKNMRIARTRPRDVTDKQWSDYLSALDRWEKEPIDHWTGSPMPEKPRPYACELPEGSILN